MKKKDLQARVSEAKDNTAEAILIMLNALNAGQRKKILKDDKVKELCERYGIEI